MTWAVFARVASLLIALAVVCLPPAVSRAASARPAQDCCAERSSHPGCPVCPTAPGGGELPCCAGVLVLALYVTPAALRAPASAKAVRTERADHWTVRRERPAVPPPR